MTMLCETTQSLLPEFTDDTLDAPTAWQVQTHLAECADCHTASREFAALRRALQGLPTQQPSARFEANLAERLALTRRPQSRRTWRDRFAGLRPAPVLRPALAFGAAAAAVAAILLVPPHPIMPSHITPGPPVTAHALDKSFVADCVAQHRREVAVEPLADLAAQNLAGHLDSTDAAPTSGPDANLLTETASADAGLF